MNNLKNNIKPIVICLILIFIVLVIVLFLNNKNILNNNKLSSSYYIEKYDANQYSPIYIDDDQIVQIYLNEYKNNMLFDIEKAWNSLNKDYRDIKFGNIDEYTKYINNFVTMSTLSMEVDKYSISNIKGKKIFNVYDKSGNQYIIKENTIMNYEIYLDNETVKID